MTSSTVWYRIWRPLGVRAPFRYCLAKVLRIGTGSLYKRSRGSRAKYQQNSAHFFQCLLASAARLEESPLAMLCAAARKLFQKLYHLEGSTVSLADPVDVKRQYVQAERSSLDLLRNMDDRRCHCLPRSQSFSGLKNGGTVGECIGGVVCGMVSMFM